MQASLLNTYLVSTTISLPTNTNAPCVPGLRFRQVGMTVHVIVIGGKPDQTRPSIKFRSGWECLSVLFHHLLPLSL
jgi:hypothetical protein